MTPKDCSSCQISAEAIAPGKTSCTDSRRAGAKRNAKTVTARLIATDAVSVTDLATVPSAPAPPPPAIDRAVVHKTASPAVTSRSTLRPRVLKGFGRLLRGTAHTVLAAYWNACATPRPP